MAGGLLMTGLFFSFHSTVLGFRVWILQLILHSNSTRDNRYEAKVFTASNSSILKNHLRNPVCLFFLDLLFCDKAQNHKTGVSVTLFWKIFTRTGFSFHRKYKVAILIISSVLVSVNINANQFSFL